MDSTNQDTLLSPNESEILNTTSMLTPFEANATAEAQRWREEAEALQQEVAELQCSRTECRAECEQLRLEARQAQGAEAEQLRLRIEEARNWERGLRVEVEKVAAEERQRYSDAVTLLEAANEAAAAEQRCQSEAHEAWCCRLQDQLAWRDERWRENVKRLTLEIARCGLDPQDLPSVKTF